VIHFSELFGKSDRTRAQKLRTRSVAEPEESLFPSALQNTPAEEAALKPASSAAILMDPQGAGADRFRYLRMRLRELRQLAKLQSVVITSPLPNDGKSTIAMCLATVLAKGGKHAVLLIEADLHNPSLAKSLGIQPRPGLAECLQSGFDAMSETRKIDPLGWYLLQAGKPKDNPTELLQSEALGALIQRVSPQFDWILIDAPPAQPLTDALSLSRHVDATLLVARADRTPREAIEETIELIGRDHVVGIVLNGEQNLTRRYSEYYGYYRAR
jgi:capsular exopolysaccharide synthesis family protein